MITFDGVPPDRITDGDITIAHLACECVKFYVGHEVQVNRPVVCVDPGDGHPTGHGLTRIEQVIRTATATVTVTIG